MAVIYKIHHPVTISKSLAYMLLSSLKHLRDGHIIEPATDYPKLDNMIAMLEKELGSGE